MTDTRVHGTRAEYIEGCRCAECTEANRIYGNRARHRKGVAPTPIYRASDRQATYGKGRKCLTCPTVLSTYNPDSLCSPCNTRRFEAEAAKSKAREDREQRLAAQRERRKPYEKAKWALTLEQEAEVRKLLKLGVSKAAIARRFNVSVGPIGRIQKHMERFVAGGFSEVSL